MYQAAGAAAQVIGQVLKMVAANKAKHAMEEAYKNELRRQRGFRNEAFGVTQDYFPRLGVEQARKEMATGEAHRLGGYDAAGQIPFSVNQPVGMGASATDKANINMAGQARANLGSYTDWQLDRMIDSIRSQDELNRINNFAAGTAGVFPYRMHDAQHSADAMSFAGDALSSVGGAVSGFGSMGGIGALGLGKKPSGFSAGNELYDLPASFGGSFAGFA